MMEQHQSRRHEPVIVVGDDGVERPGTIEFGDEEYGQMSIYCERGGRIILYGKIAERVRPDPGGARPIWDRVSGRAR